MKQRDDHVTTQVKEKGPQKELNQDFLADSELPMQRAQV